MPWACGRGVYSPLRRGPCSRARATYTTRLRYTSSDGSTRWPHRREARRCSLPQARTAARLRLLLELAVGELAAELLLLADGAAAQLLGHGRVLGARRRALGARRHAALQLKAVHDVGEARAAKAASVEPDVAQRQRTRLVRVEEPAGRRRCAVLDVATRVLDLEDRGSAVVGGVQQREEGRRVELPHRLELARLPLRLQLLVAAVHEALYAVGASWQPDELRRERGDVSRRSRVARGVQRRRERVRDAVVIVALLVGDQRPGDGRRGDGAVALLAAARRRLPGVGAVDGLAAAGLAVAQQLGREEEGDVGGRQRIRVGYPQKASVRELARRHLLSSQRDEYARVDRQPDAGVVPRDVEEARLVELARLLQRDAPAIAARVGP
eukprot:scaffold124878_cov63-Phaeocystis_antarctica.AAC.1